MVQNCKVRLQIPRVAEQCDVNIHSVTLPSTPANYTQKHLIPHQLALEFDDECITVSTRAIGDGPRNFEPGSRDEDNTCVGTPLPNYHTMPTGGLFILWQVNKQKTPRCLDQLTFRTALARQPIDEYSSRKRKERPASFQANKRVVLDDVR
ncbi:hypothetical protein TNCV_1240421 [Trichonephila clavipes]|uniref:Uncharacterized protein n=1 Tax=Trichonephila clavipes TaxID=2585209 RepID=A0A8X6WFR4_TRICX|nr:hypothetical protein TNCV_1240421 [Trichonephila clavipes]